jgi:hypothetical protein
LLTAFLLLAGSAIYGAGADRAGLALERRFEDTVHPFLETYCFACHNQQKQKGKLDLTPYAAPGAVTLDYRRWEGVLAKLKAGEMPPEEAKKQPPPALRREVVDWVQSWRKHEVQRHADDPGPVLARRLSSAEYNNTIRDLTGVDLRPAREFPVDPANEAGFDNSGESLTMSPALLKKYFEAARAVADHLVLKPNGLAFAPHPVVTETDRDKYCVQRIVEFYRRQPTNLADYFETAWRFQHRVRLGQPKATLAGLAARDQISPKYLALVWGMLTTPEELGPLARLQAMWRQLASPKAAQPARLRGDERIRRGRSQPAQSGSDQSLHSRHCAWIATVRVVEGSAVRRPSATLRPQRQAGGHEERASDSVGPDPRGGTGRDAVHESPGSRP